MGGYNQSTMANLDKARSAMMHQAAIRRGIKTSTVSFADVLDDPEPVIARLHIATFLTWLPRISDFRAKQICARADVEPYLTVGELEREQKYRIIDEAPVWA